MINNRFCNRAALLALMFMLYAVGLAAGRDQATLAHHQHSACHQGLKP